MVVGIASGMLATMRNIGMVMGVAISGAVFTSTTHWLEMGLKGKGLSGAPLNAAVFVGALHLTFSVGAVFALAGMFASLIKGSTRTGNSD